MELRGYLGVLRQWVWLIVGCTVLAGGVSYIVSISLPKSYEATATLIVGQSLTIANPDAGQLAMSVRLSQTYAAVVTLGPTLQSIIESLDLPVTPDELRDRVKAKAALDSTLLTISASDADPVVAAAIANAIANELIDESRGIQGQQALDPQFVDQELKSLQAQSEQINEQISQLNSLSSRTPQEREEKAQLLETLQSRFAGVRATYAAMLPFASDSITNLLTLVDPAVPPETPSSPKVLLNTLLAAFTGLLIAVGIALLMEYLNDTLKSPDDVAAVAGLPTLGVIARTKPGKRQEQRLATLASPRAPASEAFRALRTNLGFASVDAPLRVVLVTSAAADEGKTVVACNLAVVFAQTGKRVILLDADLRRPGIHRAFHLPNGAGLSTLLREDEPALDAVAQQVQEGLRIITSGPLPPNPAELLGSQRMREILNDLKQEADMVIVDSPPLQAGTDAAVLATVVDGTLLVIDASQTRKGAVRQAREALDRVEARVLGVVLNKFVERAGSEYHGYDGSYGPDNGTTVDQPSPPTASPEMIAPY